MKKTYVHVALFSSRALGQSATASDEGPAVDSGARVLRRGLLPPRDQLRRAQGHVEYRAFITNVSPVFTMLIAQLFLGEELRRRSWIGVGISLAGVWVVASAHGGSVSAGIGAAVLLGAALCWSLFFVLQKPLLTYYRPLEVTCYSVWIGTLFLGFLIPDSLAMSRNAPWPATLSAIYLGLFPTALAYVSWSYVLAHMPASRASAYTYLIPPLSTAIAVVWVNETPSAFFLIGGVAILAGVAIATESAAR